jgi:hypothetical protein
MCNVLQVVVVEAGGNLWLKSAAWSGKKGERARGGTRPLKLMDRVKTHIMGKKCPLVVGVRMVGLAGREFGTNKQDFFLVFHWPLHFLNARSPCF